MAPSHVTPEGLQSMSPRKGRRSHQTQSAHGRACGHCKPDPLPLKSLFPPLHHNGNHHEASNFSEVTGKIPGVQGSIIMLLLKPTLKPITADRQGKVRENSEGDVPRSKTSHLGPLCPPSKHQRSTQWALTAVSCSPLKHVAHKPQTRNSGTLHLQMRTQRQ